MEPKIINSLYGQTEPLLLGNQTDERKKNFLTRALVAANIATITLAGGAIIYLISSHGYMPSTSVQNETEQNSHISLVNTTKSAGAGSKAVDTRCIALNAPGTISIPGLNLRTCAWDAGSYGNLPGQSNINVDGFGGPVQCLQMASELGFNPNPLTVNGVSFYDF
jgi:hypothetical protein